MGKFALGDTVEDEFGNRATVVGSQETISVQWHDLNNIVGMWPADDFRLVPRPFRPGQYVRIVNADEEYNDKVGVVFLDDGDADEDQPFWVAIFDDGEMEAPFSSDELIPWIPKMGERVIEKVEGTEDEVGTVLSVNGDCVRVLWDEYTLAQDFPLSELEPADEDAPEFNEGDAVDYHHPMFAMPIRAQVMAGDGDGVRLKFPSGIMPEGNYDSDFISKAA